MNRLESRKQLLLSESELNRALLVQQCKAVAIGYHVMADQASAFGALAASAADWIGSLQTSSAPRETQSIHTTNTTTEHLITGMRLLLEVWQEIQSLRGK